MQSIPRLLAVSLLTTAATASAAVLWRDAPGYLDLFAPTNRQQAYAIAVTAASLGEVLGEAAGDRMAVAVPGAWQARSESPEAAFGTAGRYNRWLLARLYGSRQPRVARGARMDRGRVIESWTLVSPYPSTDLRVLHPGTMRLILKASP